MSLQSTAHRDWGLRIKRDQASHLFLQVPEQVDLATHRHLI